MRVLWAMVAGGLLVGVSPAFAADAPATSELSIDVSATIAQRCGIAPLAGGSAQPDLEGAASMSFGFALDCNTPFAIGVSSRNGGLRLAGSDLARSMTTDGFATVKPYSVALNVGTDGGDLKTSACVASDLTAANPTCTFFGAVAGRGLSSADRTAVQRTGTIDVNWGADTATSPRRAAGEYQDIITIVVGVRS